MSQNDTIEKTFNEKVKKLQNEFPNHQMMSTYECWARMNLSDEELWYVSALQIKSDEKNMVWEGFESYDEETMYDLIKTTFDNNKKSIEAVKQELNL